MGGTGRMGGTVPSRPSSPSSLSCQRSEEHTSELQSQSNLVCRLLLEKKKSIHDNKQCFLKITTIRFHNDVSALKKVISRYTIRSHIRIPRTLSKLKLLPRTTRHETRL